MQITVPEVSVQTTNSHLVENSMYVIITTQEHISKHTLYTLISKEKYILILVWLILVVYKTTRPMVHMGLHWKSVGILWTKANLTLNTS